MPTENALVQVRAARAIAVCKGNPVNAQRYAAQWGNAVVSYIERSITDTGSLQAGSVPLLDLGSHLVQLVRRKSAIERVNNVMPFYRVPPFLAVLSLDVDASAGWTAEAAKITVSGQGFSTYRIGALKSTAMAVYTQEFLRSVDPNVDTAIQRDLSRALAKVEDKAFFDPANGGDAATPPSPFYGHTLDGSGDISNDIDTLLANADPDLLGEIVLTFNAADTPALMKSHLAGDSTLNAVDGGFLAGLPAVPAPVPRGAIGFVAPALIAMTEAGANIEASTQSTVEVVDDATGTSSVVSLWQQDLASLRAVHYLNWRAGRADAAGMVTNVIGGTT
ncbi:HK97 family phage major capsid protein [Paraburkholderia unamae]|uniref:phage major capsid protein n=1 Tax=Paraburkholderia unamae TaxID=219649 RepID=UPI000DC274E2|nr:phage major capsid protein [Paraburkholderia unamae]RAR51468.1 HK97 family phage major capsid protein [Paraburkholderia unamae]